MNLLKQYNSRQKRLKNESKRRQKRVFDAIIESVKERIRSEKKKKQKK